MSAVAGVGPQRGQHLVARDAREIEVEQDRVGRLRRADLQGRFAVRRFDDLVAVVVELPREHGADDERVVDDDDEGQGGAHPPRIG